MLVNLIVNRRNVELDVQPHETLLTSLRNGLELIGTKEACVEGECGACTVLIDGKPVDSCIYSTAASAGLSITTVEGLRGVNGELSPLQQAFIDHFAVQCGFCTPGLLMTLTALLNSNPDSDRAEIHRAVAGNLCRCTGYAQVVEAVETVVRAAQQQ